MASRAPIAPTYRLHDLACTGSTPATGCVCMQEPKQPVTPIRPYLEKAEGHRQRAEELASGIEALLGKFARLEVVPLDVAERVERAIVAAHVSNLERVSRISERALLELDR